MTARGHCPVCHIDAALAGGPTPKHPERPYIVPRHAIYVVGDPPRRPHLGDYQAIRREPCEGSGREPVSTYQPDR